MAESTLIKELASFPWGAAKRVSTKNGERALMKFSPVTERFWALWKAHKETLKEAGVSVSSYSGSWEAAWWLPPSMVEQRDAFFALLKEGKEAEALDLLKTTPKPKPAPPQEVKLIEVPSGIAAKLKPHQVPAASRLATIINAAGAALDASGTGTGKTYAALGAVLTLGLRPLIICPKAILPGWERALKHFGIQALAVVNYDLIKTGKQIKKRVSSRAKTGFVVDHVESPFIEIVTPQNQTRFKWNIPSDGIIIFDEAHRCKNRSAINTELMIAATNQGIKALMLSATIGESPIKLYAIAHRLGLYPRLRDFWAWAEGFGCRKVQVSRTQEAFQFVGSDKDLERLHNILFPAKGVRIRAEEIPEFPANFVMAEIVDMNSNAAKIQKAYADMAKELVKLETNKKNMSDNPLSVRQKYRQIIELLKVPTLVEMTEDLIESGNAVVIFVNFTATLQALCEKLGTRCTIYGENNGTVNESNRKAFHEDRERVIVCNVQAAREGIDLHDVNGKFPRVSLLTPSDNAQDLLQCLGRIHRVGGKTKCVQKIVFCEGTIEEDVAANVEAKILNINTLNDGDLAANVYGAKRSVNSTQQDEHCQNCGNVIEPEFAWEHPEMLCMKCFFNNQEPSAEELAQQDEIVKKALLTSVTIATPVVTTTQNSTGKKFTPRPELEAGIYYKDGVVYKVQKALYGSGAMYAKKLVINNGEGRFIYDPGAIMNLTPQDIMTLEQAASFGKIYGICGNCGRPLTNEESIEAGIGPVCAGRFKKRKGGN